MKMYVSVLLGTILSAITLYFVANHREHGDTNAVGMYMIVYILPLIGLSLCNGIILKVAENRNKYIKILFGSFFPLVSIVLLVLDDASLNFVGLIILIAFGIVNFVWLAIHLEDKHDFP